MTTSGTVGKTVFDSSKVIEHAFRRCRVHPSQQTPETVDIAKENLYLLLTNMPNLGINLWAVEKSYVPCVTGQQVYLCPTGTIDLLNLTYSQPQRATGTDSTTATSKTTWLGFATTIVRVGVKMSGSAASGTLSVRSSDDGVNFTVILEEAKTDWQDGTMYWFDIDPSVSAEYFKASFSSNVAFTEFYLATSVYDLPVTQWNRDTWAAMTSKTQRGRPVTTYYFEKLINPQITAWPVPNNEYDFFTMFVHRQIEDVGTLTQIGRASCRERV